MIRKVLPLAAAFALSFSVASAQEPQTPLQKQIARMDFGVSAVGIFNKSVSGPITASNSTNTGQIVGDAPGNTVGALVTLRYVAKPLVGFEFNYGYARYTQNFSNTPGNLSTLGVQSQANEYTVGYLVTPDYHFFGLDPYVSIGAGSMAFKPTPGGGLGLKTQARATYYYNVGVQKLIFDSSFGMRIGFRQNFFLVPDYGQNYLTILKRSTTSSPYIGFYYKF